MIEKLKSNIVKGCKVVIINEESYVKTKHLYNLLDRTKKENSTSMVAGITECCGYDFGLDGFKSKVRFCPICGKEIKI